MDNVINTESFKVARDIEGESGNQFGGDSTGCRVFGVCDGVVGDYELLGTGLVAGGAFFREHCRGHVAVDLAGHLVGGGIVVNDTTSFTAEDCEDFVDAFMSCMAAAKAGWA